VSTASTKRHAAVLFAVAVVVGSAGLLDAPAGAVDFNGTFRAESTADAVRITVIVPYAPLSNTVMDGGGPSTHAVLDTTGRSEAYASFPYPGENVVTAPPLIAGASGGQINLPAYPFFVGSNHPSVPKQEAGSGLYTIKAESSDASSTGSATAGINSEGQAALGLARSSSSTVAAAEGVTSQASTEITSFALGPLRLGRVFSNAKAVLGSDGNLTREADTQIVGTMVGDTAVAITPKGVVVAGQATPLDTKAVHDLLSQAKIDAQVMPREDPATGVVAPAVRVTQQDQSSGTKATYLIGAASAFVDGFVTAPLDGTSSDTTATAPYDGSGGSGGSSTAPPASTAAAGPGGNSVPAEAASPVTAAAPEPGPAVKPPVSFVVPSAEQLAGPVANENTPAAEPGDAAPGQAAAAPSPAPGSLRPTRAQLAARLLVSPSDTTPLFAVMAVATAAALGLLAVLKRKLKVR
jgi:hypothetical protein